MVDWTTLWLRTETPIGWNTGELMHVNRDGELVTKWAAKEPVDHPSHDARFQLWAPDQCTLRVSGNPAKFTQGHNLWGTGDYALAVFAAGESLRRVAHAPFPGSKTFDRCRPGHGGSAKLTRLDVTRSIRMDSQKEAEALVGHIGRTAHTRHKSRKHVESGTAYFGTTSRRWAAKVYSKLPEFSRWQGTLKGFQRRGALAHDWADLWDWAEGVVRFEFTIKQQELEVAVSMNGGRALHDVAYGAGIGEDWALATWREYYARIEMSSGETDFEPDKLAELSNNERMTAFAWRKGVEPKAVLAHNTFYRHRRAIKKVLGVDIAEPVRERGPAMGPIAADDPRWDPEPLTTRRGATAS